MPILYDLLSKLYGKNNWCKVASFDIGNVQFELNNTELKIIKIYRVTDFWIFIYLTIQSAFILVVSFRTLKLIVKLLIDGFEMKFTLSLKLKISKKIYFDIFKFLHSNFIRKSESIPAFPLHPAAAAAGPNVEMPCVGFAKEKPPPGGAIARMHKECQSWEFSFPNTTGMQLVWSGATSSTPGQDCQCFTGLSWG